MRTNEKIRQVQQLRAKIKRKQRTKRIVLSSPKASWIKVPHVNDPTRKDDTLVTVGMASIPARERGMYAVLNVLLPQCDRFDLSLNGYPNDYKMKITDPKLNIFRNPPDIGPHGKLFMAQQTAGYFLTVDDDLIYPDTYVRVMVAGINKYARTAYVGFHGNLIAERQTKTKNITWQRCLFSHTDRLAHDIPVHMLGTGIFGYHSHAGRIDCMKLLYGKIDDQVASWAQDRRIPMIALAHPNNWVREDKSLYLAGTPLRRNAQKSNAAKTRIRDRTWTIYLPNNWKKYHR